VLEVLANVAREEDFFTVEVDIGCYSLLSGRLRLSGKGRYREEGP